MNAFFQKLAADLSYAVRQLRQSPTFTSVAILTLALGIGANTAMFSLVHAILMKTLPVVNPQELRHLGWTSKKPAFASSTSSTGSLTPGGENLFEYFSYPAYVAVRDRATSFSELFCFNSTGVNLGIGGRAEWGQAQLISGNYFRALGVPPLLGRTLQPEDDQPGGLASVAVLSYGFWQRSYGGNADILNRPIAINGKPFVIVGVMPRGFVGIDTSNISDVMVPIAWHAAVSGRTGVLQDQRNWTVCRIIGRLRPEVPEAKARAESEVLIRQVLVNPQEGNYDPPTLWLTDASQGIENLRRGTRPVLLILMSVSGVVLLIACANLAGLLLARSTVRQREIATRLALGAPRIRLIQQLLTESLLLSSLGGGLGILLAFALSNRLPGLLLGRWVPLDLDVSPGLGVLALSVGLTLLTGVFFGLAPALRATRVDLLAMIKEGTAGASVSHSRFSAGKAFLTAQVALSLLLLVTTGLFVRTVINLQAAPLGFEPKGLLVFRINPSLNGYRDTRMLDFMQQGVTRLESVPGVLAVSMSQAGLLSGTINTGVVCVPGYMPTNPADRATPALAIAPRFFETWKIPLLLGRDFSWGDREGAPRVAVVNEAFARIFYGGKNPVGLTMGYECPDKPSSITIIGLVADTKYQRVRETIRPTVYLPYRQWPRQAMTFALRTLGNPAAIAGTVRRVMAELDSNVPIFNLYTQIEQIDRGIQQERLITYLLVFLGLIALSLSCLGIYGTLGYAVNRRASEIGLRIALGARRAHIIGMVLRESLVPVIVGIVLGLCAAFALTRLVQGMYFGISPNDPLSIVVAVAALLLAAILASLLPARRAASIDPMNTLRSK